MVNAKKLLPTIQQATLQSKCKQHQPATKHWCFPSFFSQCLCCLVPNCNALLVLKRCPCKTPTPKKTKFKSPLACSQYKCTYLLCLDFCALQRLLQKQALSPQTLWALLGNGYSPTSGKHGSNKRMCHLLRNVSWTSLHDTSTYTHGALHHKSHIWQWHLAPHTLPSGARQPCSANCKVCQTQCGDLEATAFWAVRLKSPHFSPNEFRMRCWHNIMFTANYRNWETSNMGGSRTDTSAKWK